MLNSAILSIPLLASAVLAAPGWSAWSDGASSGAPTSTSSSASWTASSTASWTKSSSASWTASSSASSTKSSTASWTKPSSSASWTASSSASWAPSPTGPSGAQGPPSGGYQGGHPGGAPPAPVCPPVNGACLTDANVKSLLDAYTYFLEYPTGADFSKIANAVLSDKFFVSSDSINQIAGIPLGVPAFPSKQAFINGQANTPPLPVVQTLGSFHTCDKISWRWNATQIGSNKYEVKGIIAMDVNPATVQIDAVYSEWNSLGFAGDIGNPECQK